MANDELMQRRDVSERHARGEFREALRNFCRKLLASGAQAFREEWRNLLSFPKLAERFGNGAPAGNSVSL
jgi:hypothetical protein